jgi:two-component system, cell cycle sensor histidine kinase and response regulator CckA
MLGLLRSNKTPVTAKIAIGYSVVLVAVCATVVIYFPQRVRESSLTALGNETRALSNVAANMLAAPIVFEDSAAIADVIAGLRRNPSVSGVTVEDGNGVRLAAWGVRARMRDGLTSDEKYLGWSSNVTNGNVTIGKLHLIVSTRWLDAEAKRQRTHVIIFSSILFFLALGFTVILTRTVLSPLSHVAEAARAIAKGDTSRRAVSETGDEIGFLAESFNQMVDALFAAQNELKASNEQLEQRVRERTRQLAGEVDERRRAELELKSSEQRFRSMFERAPIGIALIDPNGYFSQCNSPMERLLGYSEGELRVMRLADLIESADVDLERAMHDLLRTDVNAEAVCAGRERRIAARIALSAVVDHLDNIQFISLMVVDLSAEKELEAKFRQAQKLEAVGRLAGGIAHDFNNLLTTITGLSELVINELPEDDSRRADVEEVKKAGERAALLTRQLLAFSRQQVLQPRVLDLNAVVNDVGRMLERLIGDNIGLSIREEANLPAVKADPGQIVQVLLNLAVNARDAMPYGGRVEIVTESRSLDHNTAASLEMAPGNCVVLSVMDTGCGIDAETLAHIFEPFFTTKEVGKGTGLGLATVYGIVKQSGGAITVQTQRNRGTTFTVLLPAHIGQEAPHEPPSAPGKRGHETVLVAEDEPNVRSYVARVLRRAGYRVLEAVDGLDALQVAQAENSGIDLLLTDAVMPRMSGAELIVKLQQQRAEVKTLVMSGYTRDTMKEQGVQLGEVAYVQKPVSPGLLTRTVRAVLDGGSIEQSEPVAV